MKELNLNGLRPAIAEKIGPFFREIIAAHGEAIHSLHVSGSAVTPDFDEKTSDINSVIVLQTMDLAFLEYLAPLGKGYRKKRIAAPLVLDPDYIRSSLDVFPVEFHDLRLIHRTVYGDDIFQHLPIEDQYLRLQCEREVKTRLIRLRQGFVSSLDDRELLKDLLSRAVTGCFPLFRALITLMGGTPPVKRDEVLSTIGRMTSIGTDIFETLGRIRRKVISPSRDELHRLFHSFYGATGDLGKIIDGLAR